MKRLISLVAIIVTPIAVSAQNMNSNEFERDIFRIFATIFMATLVMIFILLILKYILDHRIKHRILEKDIPEGVAASILQIKPKEDRNSNIKWFSMLTGLGAGLTVVNFTLPIGIHSLAIMAFFLGASFLGYFLFLRYADKEK